MSDTTVGGLPHDHATPVESAALAEFRAFRERMNTRILGENNLVINRFSNLDGPAYETGALDVKTKELPGLVASLDAPSTAGTKPKRCAAEAPSADRAIPSYGRAIVFGLPSET